MRWSNRDIDEKNADSLSFKRSIHRHSNRGVLNALRASIGTLSIVPEVLKKKRRRSGWMRKWGTVWMKSSIVNRPITPPPLPTIFSAEES